MNIILTFAEALMNAYIFISWSSIQALNHTAMSIWVIQLIFVVNYLISHEHFINGQVSIGSIMQHLD